MITSHGNDFESSRFSYTGQFSIRVSEFTSVANKITRTLFIFVIKNTRLGFIIILEIESTYFGVYWDAKEFKKSRHQRSYRLETLTKFIGLKRIPLNREETVVRLMIVVELHHMG